MGTVQAQAIMSLDGYVAKQDNTIGPLFDWYFTGDHYESFCEFDPALITN